MSCECGMDIVIVAQSFIYFEKLILQVMSFKLNRKLEWYISIFLKGLINKANRKYLAGTCLLLAAKLNDLTKKEINRLIDIIVQRFRLDNRKELISFEFPILIALEFNLITNYERELANHYDRIVTYFYTNNKTKKSFSKKIKNFEYI